MISSGVTTLDGLVVDSMLLGCCFIASSHSKKTKFSQIIDTGIMSSLMQKLVFIVLNISLYFFEIFCLVDNRQKSLIVLVIRI